VFCAHLVGTGSVTQTPPDTGAARHGSGGADLTVTLSAHRAFTRDLVSPARAAAAADLASPALRQATAGRLSSASCTPTTAARTSSSGRSEPAGYPTPAAPSPSWPPWPANTRTDPLPAAIDAAFVGSAHDRLADVIDA
jgi:hypothetical protein